MKAVEEKKEQDENKRNQYKRNPAGISEEVKEYLQKAVKDSKKYDTKYTGRISELKNGDSSQLEKKVEQRYKVHQQEQQQQQQYKTKNEEPKKQLSKELLDKLIDYETKKNNGSFVGEQPTAEEKERFELWKHTTSIWERQLLYEFSRSLRN